MLPGPVETTVGRYLHLADRLLPGRLAGFYVVGSTALGAFRPGRSDIDFVAVVDRPLATGELARLRLVHALSAGRSAVRALVRGRLALPGTCNGVFVLADDLTTPVTEITPVASHVAGSFQVAHGFDVNPVTWKVLAERGLAVRGPAPGSLGLRPEPERLRRWNLANLDAYWQPWAHRAQRGRTVMDLLHPRRWSTAWGALGAPRLHCTIATGEVVSKEAAGEYALATFDAEWHPIVNEALAYWREQPSPDSAAFPDGAARNRLVGRFVEHVVTTAHTL
jgi:hypothetical protein